jgi:hypothetical protein
MLMSLRERARFLKLAALNLFVMSYGTYTTAPGLRGGSHSKKYKDSPGALGGAPGFSFADTLIDPGFTVPFTSSVNVSGGGAALQTAVSAAPAGRKIVITDSLTYSPVAVVGCTNLTIEAASGQTPQIQRAVPAHTLAGWCLSLQGVIDGFAIRGVKFHGNGNRNTLSQSDDGLLNLRPNTTDACTAADRIIVEDCSFVEDGTDNVNSGPGLLFTGTDGLSHLQVLVHRCTFSSNANGAFTTGADYGACTIGGFGTVYIQNSKVVRDNAVVTRAASNMRGVVLKNLSSDVQDVLCEDLGTGGSCEAFKISAAVVLGTAVGNTTFNNCVAFNCHRGFRLALAVAGMKTLHCVFFNNVAAIAAAQTIMQTGPGGVYLVEDTIIQSVATGTAFSAAGVSEDHNDIFSVASNGKVLDGTDLTVDPVLSNVGLHDFRATTPAVATGGTLGSPMGVRYPGGEVIFWAGV